MDTTVADADMAMQAKHSFLLLSAEQILCLKVKVAELVRLTHADVDCVNTVYRVLPAPMVRLYFGLLAIGNKLKY